MVEYRYVVGTIHFQNYAGQYSVSIPSLEVYATIERKSDIKPLDGLEKILNDLGKEGWEISASPTSKADSDYSTECTLILKRAYQERPHAPELSEVDKAMLKLASTLSPETKRELAHDPNLLALKRMLEDNAKNRS